MRETFREPVTSSFVIAGEWGEQRRMVPLPRGIRDLGRTERETGQTLKWLHVVFTVRR